MAWPEEDGVVFISGIARGQGRSHAVRFAQLGAPVAGVDLCADVSSVPYGLATERELEITKEELVSVAGTRVFVEKADVRDRCELKGVVERVESQLGPIGVVLANAGIFSVSEAVNLAPELWSDVIDINLTGAWNTVQACLPGMVARHRGSIVFTSSIGGLQGLRHCCHYVASKHGVIGLMRALANELGPEGIRVNAVCPTNVDTQMIHNDTNYSLFRPDLASPVREDIIDKASLMHLLPVPWVDPGDVTNAIIWLCSPEARYVTGITLPVDAGATAIVP